MKHNPKNFCFILIVLALVILPFFTNAQFTDTFKNEFGRALGNAAETGTYSPAQADEGFINTQIGRIILLVFSFIGLIFFILIIYSGIQWMTAGGNEEKINKAKSRVINAAIGLIIILCAYFITSFVYKYFDEKFLTEPQGRVEKLPSNDCEKHEGLCYPADGGCPDNYAGFNYACDSNAFTCCVEQF